MNYIDKMSRGCCCGLKISGVVIRDFLLELIVNKINELTGDPNNPLTLEAALQLINERLDESLEIVDDDEFATDEDIENLFKN